MGGKSVSFVDESALLRPRPREMLNDRAELSLGEVCRHHRNSARPVGQLHTPSANLGAQIVVVAGGSQAAEREELHEDDALSLFVKPIEQDRLVHAALRLAH